METGAAFTGVLNVNKCQQAVGTVLAPLRRRFSANEHGEFLDFLGRGDNGVFDAIRGTKKLEDDTIFTGYELGKQIFIAFEGSMTDTSVTINGASGETLDVDVVLAGGAIGKEYVVLVNFGTDDKPGGEFSTIGGHYEDVYVKTPAGWRCKRPQLTRLNVRQLARNARLSP